MSFLRQFTYTRVLIACLLLLPFFAISQKSKKSDSKSDKTSPSGSKSNRNAVFDYKVINAPMPQIRAVYPGKAVYTSNSFQGPGNLLIMLFNPTCEHCEDMTIDIIKNIALFKKTQILLMATPIMGPYLAGFENDTKLNSCPSIKMGLDSAGFLDKTFNYVALPQINIYGPDRKLIRTFNGLETIDSLKPYL